MKDLSFLDKVIGATRHRNEDGNSGSVVNGKTKTLTDKINVSGV